MKHLPSRPKKKPGNTGFPRRLGSLPDTVNKACLNVPTVAVAVVLRKVLAKNG